VVGQFVIPVLTTPCPLLPLRRGVNGAGVPPSQELRGRMPVPRRARRPRCNFQSSRRRISGSALSTASSVHSTSMSLWAKETNRFSNASG